MNEQEKFLSDTQADPTVVDIFEQPLNADDPAKGESESRQEEDDSDEQQPRNRRERRLMERLQSERESASFLAGKLEARTEAQRLIEEESDYLKGVERIYGTDSTEAQLATELLKKAIIGAREEAKQAAIEEIRQERYQEIEAESEAESELDGMIEEIEDEYGVNLTASQEQAYFQLLERMSPKDRNGEVTEYADPHAVWEVFQERTQRRPADTRAKDLSSRSMVNSGSSKESNLTDDVQLRFLRENGII